MEAICCILLVVVAGESPIAAASDQERRLRRRKEKRHEKIISQSSKMLRARGITGTSLVDLMRAAGMTHGERAHRLLDGER